MITGDKHITAAQIVDRDVLILDLREGASDESDLVWRTVDDSKIISARAEEPLDAQLLEDYDICMTGAALKQFASTPSWQTLVQHVWVYARVSPAQKEFILTTLRQLGYTTLMAGDGTNDVGALKQAHIGVALLNGTEEDLKKIAEHQKIERFKKVYESQLKLSQRFNAPPPPVPPILAQVYPEMVAAQQKAKAEQASAKKADPYSKFNLSSITDKLSEMEDDNEPPTIKLGDASVAAPFTSKLANVQASMSIVSTNLFITYTSFCLSHSYHQTRALHSGRNYADVQNPGAQLSDLSIQSQRTISRWYQIRRLSSDHYWNAHVCSKYSDACVPSPLLNILSFAVLPMHIASAPNREAVEGEAPQQHLQSVHRSFRFAAILDTHCHNALHDATLQANRSVSISSCWVIRYGAYQIFACSPKEAVDLEAEYKPSLLNTAIYLISLSQQVSTFAVNFQGRPFREGITENPALYYGLL